MDPEFIEDLKKALAKAEETIQQLAEEKKRLYLLIDSRYVDKNDAIKYLKQAIDLLEKP